MKARFIALGTAVTTVLIFTSHATMANEVITTGSAITTETVTSDAVPTTVIAPAPAPAIVTSEATATTTTTESRKLSEDEVEAREDRAEDRQEAREERAEEAADTVD